MNKVKAELTSRALRKEIADLDAQSKKIADQQDILTARLQELRNNSTEFPLFNGSSTTTYNKFSQLEVDKLSVKEIWLNDRIYIDALGIHNLDEKEGK